MLANSFRSCENFDHYPRFISRTVKVLGANPQIIRTEEMVLGTPEDH